MQRVLLASLISLLLACVATSARADLRHVVISSTTGAPMCIPFTNCTSDAECTVSGETCVPVMTGDGLTHQVCRGTLADDIFCCSASDTAATCPAGDTCRTIGTGMTAVPALCDDGRMYCLTDPTHVTDADLLQIESCFFPPVPPCAVPRPPRDMTFVPYGMGDCDGDGIPNAIDGHICLADTPMCLVDGGTPPPDDGGRPDATTITDLGTPEQDSGVEPSPDAGTAEMDAGTATTSPGLSFRGGGGCNCQVDETFHGGSVAALAPLLLLSRRRRR